MKPHQAGGFLSETSQYDMQISRLSSLLTYLFFLDKEGKAEKMEFSHETRDEAAKDAQQSKTAQCGGRRENPIFHEARQPMRPGSPRGR